MQDSGSKSINASNTTGGSGKVKPPEDETDLVDMLWKYVFPYWKKYCVGAFIGAVVFTAVSYTFHPKYTAEIKAQVDVGSASNALKSKFGGLAALAGMNLNAGDAQFMFNINYISSRELADAFMAKYDLRRELFNSKNNEDDEEESKLRLKRLYVKLLGKDYEKTHDDDIYLTPGASKASMFKRFDRVFTIDVNQKDMTVDVSVSWKDPLKAKQWANDYIKLVNSVLKDKAIDESNRKIKYLESQIKEKPEIEVQQSIYSMIEDELKQIAVAESSEEYAFKVIQRAYLPERKVSPKRKEFLVAGAFFGIACVFGYLFLPGYLRETGIWKRFKDRS